MKCKNTILQQFKKLDDQFPHVCVHGPQTHIQKHKNHFIFEVEMIVRAGKW